MTPPPHPRSRLPAQRPALAASAAWLAAALAGGCTQEPPAVVYHTAAEQPRPMQQPEIATLWPPMTAAVPATFDLRVGYGMLQVDGRIAVLRGGEPLPAGAGPGDRRIAEFAAGSNCGEVTLPPGEQTIAVQVLDGSGRSRGPEWSAAVTYTVVPADKPRRVWIKDPADGATVEAELRVRIGVEGLVPARAGAELLDMARCHFWLLIDRGPMPAGLRLPHDDRHAQLGGGELAGRVALPPGTHTLTVQAADGFRTSFGPRLAHTITVRVQ